MLLRLINEIYLKNLHLIILMMKEKGIFNRLNQLLKKLGFYETSDLTVLNDI